MGAIISENLEGFVTVYHYQGIGTFTICKNISSKFLMLLCHTIFRLMIRRNSLEALISRFGLLNVLVSF